MISYIVVHRVSQCIAIYRVSYYVSYLHILVTTNCWSAIKIQLTKEKNPSDYYHRSCRPPPCGPVMISVGVFWGESQTVSQSVSHSSSNQSVKSSRPCVVTTNSSGGGGGGDSEFHESSLDCLLTEDSVPAPHPASLIVLPHQCLSLSPPAVPCTACFVVDVCVCVCVCITH